VAAGDIPTKFGKCISTGGCVIAFCGKIQNNGARHLELLFGNSGPSTKSTCRPEVASKFRIDRACTFKLWGFENFANLL